MQRLLREKKEYISKNLAVGPNQHIPTGKGKCALDWVLGGQDLMLNKRGFLNVGASTTKNLTQYQDPQNTALRLEKAELSVF